MNQSRALSILLLPALMIALTFIAPPAAAQSVQGTVSITVTDPAGAVIPGAKLELKDAATNDLRAGVSRTAAPTGSLASTSDVTSSP